MTYNYLYKYLYNFFSVKKSIKYSLQCCWHYMCGALHQVRQAKLEQPSGHGWTWVAKSFYKDI